MWQENKQKPINDRILIQIEPITASDSNRSPAAGTRRSRSRRRGRGAPPRASRTEANGREEDKSREGGEESKGNRRESFGREERGIRESRRPDGYVGFLGTVPVVPLAGVKCFVRLKDRLSYMSSIKISVLLRFPSRTVSVYRTSTFPDLAFGLKQRVAREPFWPHRPILLGREIRSSQLPRTTPSRTRKRQRVGCMCQGFGLNPSRERMIDILSNRETLVRTMHNFQSFFFFFSLSC